MTNKREMPVRKGTLQIARLNTPGSSLKSTEKRKNFTASFDRSDSSIDRSDALSALSRRIDQAS